jgi:hypothetical protein
MEANFMLKFKHFALLVVIFISILCGCSRSVSTVDLLNVADYTRVQVVETKISVYSCGQSDNEYDISLVTNYFKNLKKENIETQHIDNPDYLIDFYGKDMNSEIVIKGEILGIETTNVKPFSNKIWDWFKIHKSDLTKLMAIYNNLPKADLEGPSTAKPVIYLYPTQIQQTKVILKYDGKLTCTYPLYSNGWDVTAYPDGKIINKADNREYSYLFWEGIPNKTDWDLSEGYVVEGKDSLCFLQDKLSELGLTPIEYNEFIVYWLPKMINNKYNLITFQNKSYEDLVSLNITPKPTSLLRVFMVFKPLDNPISIGPPQIKPFNRKGFTVVEWGGTEINN